LGWGWSNIFTRNERIVISFIIGILILGGIVKSFVPEKETMVEIEKKTEVNIFPIDVNTASSELLQEVPGIGPKTADAIIEFREKRGRIRKLEELQMIKGIGKKKIEKWKKYLTVGRE